MKSTTKFLLLGATLQSGRVLAAWDWRRLQAVNNEPSLADVAREMDTAAARAERNSIMDSGGYYEDAAMRELHKAKGNHHHETIPVIPQIVPLPAQVPMVQVAPITVSLKQELACPEGYDLKGSRCVANELLAPDLTCPPGSELFDGRCAQFTRGRRECPEGYRVSGTRCVATDIVPAEFTCQEGELDETGQGCRIFSQTGPQCPTGFRLDPMGELCMQQFPAQVACPPGHQMQKHGCVKEVGFEASPMCPIGSELDASGNKCFTMSPGKAKCPKGFKLSHNTGKCVKKTKKALAACPGGFTEYSGHKAICERMLTVPPQLTCPPGAALDPASGQCQTDNIGAAQCPDGFVNSRTQPHICERIVEEVGVCPPGSTTLGYGPDVRCQSAIEHEIIECCPPGFRLLGNQCQRHEVFAAVAKCQGDCSRIRLIPPVLRCPVGFELDGRRCARITSYPCPEVASECTPFVAARQTVSLRRLSEEQIPASCVANIRAVELCHNEEAIPAELACPEGVFDGTNCVVRDDMSDAQPICRYGVMDLSTGQCIKVSYAPVKTECPIGTTRIGRRCVEYDEHPPEFICPDGAVADRSGSCIVRAPSLVSVNEVLRTAPIPVCAAGTLQGSLCYDVERVPRQFVCPDGAIPAGKHADAAVILDNPIADANKYCMVVTDMMVPPPVRKYVKPKFYCPDGTLAKGAHCHSHDKAEPIVSCPQGSIMEGQLCKRTLPAVMGGSRVSSALPVPICPAGTIVQGTKCVATREAPVDVVCPPGYVSQIAGYNVDKECIRYGDMVAVCPMGTIQTAEGCLRERSTTPIVNTVSSCVDNLCP